jgi:hypothetical protein
VSPESTPQPVYLYSICPQPAQPLPLPLGLAEPTQLISVGAIAALIETNIDLVALQSDEPRLLNAVLSHDRVICELFQHTPLLPLRFGTQIASVDHLKSHLANQGADYTVKLATLAGKAEYQLKLIPQPVDLPPPPEGLTGREYFLAKKQRIQDQTAAQEQQQEALTTLLDKIHSTYDRCVVGESPAGEAKLYVLIDRTTAAELEQRVAEWQSQVPQWQVLLSEALPPYHFV